jgi:NADPH:quinone reductase-like Zn-dependent oxidoreductase
MIDTRHSSGTMRAWAINRYGDPMELMELPIPIPGPGDVLMKMQGAEVGDWDELVRTGAWDMERPFPLVLGLAGAGTIVALGADVQRFQEFQVVYAYSYPLADNGAWAEYMLVPEDYVAAAPKSLPPVEAGALPVVGLTAHEAILDVLAVNEDDVVLVNAAAGGVGHLAVQLAVQRGAQVVATASKRNHDFVASLGAHTVIDYDATDDMAKAIRARYPDGVDKALNCIPGEPANQYVWALKDGGKMLDLPGAVSVRRPEVEIISDYVVRGDGARLELLTRLVDDDIVHLAIHSIVPFANAPEALNIVLTKHVRGKVVLHVA